MIDKIKMVVADICLSILWSVCDGSEYQIKQMKDCSFMDEKFKTKELENTLVEVHTIGIIIDRKQRKIKCG
jgi:hypothetical protein